MSSNFKGCGFSCFQSATEFSSRDRYDRFDTSPSKFSRKRLLQLESKLESKKGIHESRVAEKVSKIKGYGARAFHLIKVVSSAPRYDRFDTAPYTLSVMHRDNHCIIAQLPSFGKHKSRGNSALPPFLKYIGNTAV